MARKISRAVLEPTFSHLAILLIPKRKKLPIPMVRFILTVLGFGIVVLMVIADARFVCLNPASALT